MYSHLCEAGNGSWHKHLWKAKLPLKIKIFMWLVFHNAILTKDNLVKRKWKGNKTCFFCNNDETIDHIFFECIVARYVWSMVAFVFGVKCRPNSLEQFWFWASSYIQSAKHFHMVGLSSVCWAIWKTRNAVCFESKRIKCPTNLVCYISSFLSYWADLQKPGNQAQLEAGAKVLKTVALQFHLKVPGQGLLGGCLLSQGEG